ncbi:hypothetical protein F4810DRAFT_700893 [Camillea tinctor]|nr:hypothetical protein F4810DRAFT_700893 [Camillea tinctor]
MRHKTNPRKGPRAVSAVSGPTPVSSTLTTPLSSALSSTYASDAEFDVNKAMGALTLNESPPNGIKAKRSKPQTPFPFLHLPSELRLKVYAHHFAGTGHVLDLDPDNYKRIHQKLAILRTCRTMYREASHYFYSTHPIRVFSTHPGRFNRIRKHLLTLMKPGQRASVTSLELRLGPGWSKPPRGWEVKPTLGLNECTSVTKLTVFVECDPGSDFFKGFRQPGGFYERFSKKLLGEILDEMPWVERIEFDAWSTVKKSGALMRGLIELSTSRGMRISWGQERGWTDAEEIEPTAPPNMNAPLLLDSGNKGIEVVA